MANTIRDYSATAAANTTVDGADISEGCSPAGINDAIRGVMADLKDVSTGAVALESPAADSLTVTGTVTADGLTVDGTAEIRSTGPTQLLIEDTDNGFAATTLSVENGGRDFHINPPQDIVLKQGGTIAQKIFTGGDISFYDSTGTTQGLFWDASAQRLGLGTTAPDTNAEIFLNGSTADGLLLSSSNASTSARLFFQNATAGEGYAILQENGDLDFRSGATAGVSSGTPRMTITSGGSVGIGTSSVNSRFEINSAQSATSRIRLKLNDSAYCYFGGYSGITGSGNADDVALYAWTGKQLMLGTNGTERLRIDSSGRVTMPYQPAFFASGGGGSFNSSGIFVGDSSAVQKTNVGNHYSYSTGRFTAPVAGVYMFSYLLTTNDTASHMVNIHINGADNLQPVLNYYNEYDSATNVVIFTLAANDYVEAHLRASSGYGYYGARFCGHLIG